MSQYEAPSAIVLAVGEESVVPLVSLAMAGYQWSADVSGADPKAVAVELRHGELPTHSKPGMSAPELAVLRAIRPGIAHVRLEQRRPWERDKPAARELEIHVNVRA